MTAEEALMEILEERALTVKAGAPIGNQNARKIEGALKPYSEKGISSSDEVGHTHQLGVAIDAGEGEENMTAHFTPDGEGGLDTLELKDATGRSVALTSSQSDELERHIFKVNGKDDYDPRIDGGCKLSRKDSVQAGAPVGNRNAAKDYSGSSMLDRIKEHDSIRHNTAISDPAEYQAHTASITAYEATDKVSDGRFSHDDAARAHTFAAGLHQKLGNNEYSEQHQKMAQSHFEKSGK